MLLTSRDVLHELSLVSGRREAVASLSSVAVREGKAIRISEVRLSI